MGMTDVLWGYMNTLLSLFPILSTVRVTNMSTDRRRPVKDMQILENILVSRPNWNASWVIQQVKQVGASEERWSYMTSNSHHKRQPMARNLKTESKSK